MVASKPGWHASQGVAGSESSSAKPAAQSVHAVEPSALYCPGMHEMHGVAGSESASIVPAGHCVHSVAPKHMPFSVPH